MAPARRAPAAVAAAAVVAAAAAVGTRASALFVPPLARRAAWTAALGLAGPAAAHGFDLLPRPPMADKRGLDELDPSQKKVFVKDRDCEEARVAVQTLTSIYSRVQLALLKIMAQYDVNLNEDLALPFKSKLTLGDNTNPIIVDVKRAGADLASLFDEPTKSDVLRATSLSAMAFYAVIRNEAVRMEAPGTQGWAAQEIQRGSVEGQLSVRGQLSAFLTALEKVLAFVDVAPPKPPSVPSS